MSLNAKCLICRNADRRRMVELGWNGGMSASAMATVLDDRISPFMVTRHLKEHTDGEPLKRDVAVEPELPLRDRVQNIQRIQIEEIERRIAFAKQRAHDMNAMREGHTDADGNPWTPVDWSDFYDILDPKAQAAIASILKTQGLTDKRESKTSELKLGLFEAMARVGLAPKPLIGEGEKVPEIIEGEVIEDD
jgi:hypothetical protein